MVGDIVRSDDPRYTPLMQNSGGGLWRFAYIGGDVWERFRDPDGAPFFIQLDADEKDKSDPSGKYRKHKYKGKVNDKYTDL